VRTDRTHAALVDRLMNLDASALPVWWTADRIGLSQPAVPLTADRFTGDASWKERVRRSLKARFVRDRRPPALHHRGGRKFRMPP
jgi:hypothetical protein